MTETIMVPHYDLADGFAAEVIDINLSDTRLDRHFFDVAQSLLFDKLVLVFRNQTITPDRLIEITRQLGKPALSLDSAYDLMGHPEISVVGKYHQPANQKALFTGGRIEWHYDLAQTLVPSIASILYGVTVPPSGGDTLFANTRAAFESMSSAEQDSLENLAAVFSFKALNTFLDQHDADRITHRSPQLPNVQHALLRKHPLTGRRAILLAPQIMTPLGATTLELIDRLMEHCTADRFVYRHVWQRGDLLMYDNLSTMHTATPFDSERYERILYRTTILP